MEHQFNPFKLKQGLRDNFWYKNLHSQSAQAVLEKLQIAWENYFKSHTKTPSGFQPKNGHFPVRWKKNGIKTVGSKLRLSLSKQTRKYLKGEHGIEFRYLRYFLHIIYREEIPDCQAGFKAMAIDLGVSNLATVVVEGKQQPYIFEAGC